MNLATSEIRLAVAFLRRGAVNPAKAAHAFCSGKQKSRAYAAVTARYGTPSWFEEYSNDEVLRLNFEFAPTNPADYSPEPIAGLKAAGAELVTSVPADLDRVVYTIKRVMGGFLEVVVYAPGRLSPLLTGDEGPRAAQSGSLRNGIIWEYIPATRSGGTFGFYSSVKHLSAHLSFKQAAPVVAFLDAVEAGRSLADLAPLAARLGASALKFKMASPQTAGAKAAFGALRGAVHHAASTSFALEAFRAAGVKELDQFPAFEFESMILWDGFTLFNRHSDLIRQEYGEFRVTVPWQQVLGVKSLDVLNHPTTTPQAYEELARQVGPKIPAGIVRQVAEAVGFARALS